MDDIFTHIDHVGMAVKDLDEAIDFYENTFGMKMLHREVNEGQGVAEAMMGVGDSTSCVQLLCPLSEDSAIGKFLARNGPGLQQVAYRVKDVEQASQTLRDRGLRMLYDEPRTGTAGSKINFIHPKDGGGILVELVQPGTGH